MKLDIINIAGRGGWMTKKKNASKFKHLKTINILVLWSTLKENNWCKLSNTV